MSHSLFDDFPENLDQFTVSMLDNMSEPTANQQAISNSLITLDFDSILQELKSVGQAHQTEQRTMVVENITNNIKQNQPMISNETSKFCFLIVSSIEMHFNFHYMVN